MALTWKTADGIELEIRDPDLTARALRTLQRIVEGMEESSVPEDKPRRGRPPGKTAQVSVTTEGNGIGEGLATA
jgi:hypothetical protein